MASVGVLRGAFACWTGRIPASYHLVPHLRTTVVTRTAALLTPGWQGRHINDAPYRLEQVSQGCTMSSVTRTQGGEAARRRDQKAEARKSLKSRLRAAVPEDLAAQSEAIAGHVLTSDFFSKSSVVAVYLTAPKLREVETKILVDSLLAADSGKRCYVPVVMDSNSNIRFLHIDATESLVEMPPFGILEPRPEYGDGSPRQDVLDNEQPLDLILMPGLGFDRNGGRLGRGGGYYDKFLEQVANRARLNGWEPPVLAALAFRQQILEEVPMSEHDQRIHYLVSEDGVHQCQPQKL